MGPFFSVVVPVHNVRAYIDECIQSVLGQDMAELELILVDDNSTDGTAELLGQQTDPRVTVVTLDHNVGPGPARNVGMERMTGRYLMFLDSDDVLTPGSLTALRARLAQAGEPDLLLFDYARWFADGLIEPNPKAALLAGAEHVGELRLTAHPELLGIFNSPCTRAYRRDFLTSLGLEFPAGYYEDIPWTLCTLMAAERITVLGWVAVLYRQREVGSILRSPSRRHFDVFEQWERVFDEVAAHPEWDRYRLELFEFMISQYDAMLLNPTRVPCGARAEFFRRAAESCRRHRPAAWRPPGEGLLKGNALRQMALVLGIFWVHDAVARNKPRADLAKEWTRGAAARIGRMMRTGRSSTLSRSHRAIGEALGRGEASVRGAGFTEE